VWFVSIAAARSVFAAGFAEGRVIGVIHGLDHTRVEFYMATQSSGAPSCSQDPQRFALDVGTMQGRAAYAALVAAMYAQTTIHAHGTGNCDLGLVEGLAWFVSDAPPP
jgi:hypothetical protein